MMSDSEAIAQAARFLEEGKLVAIPTETVYGLAADADNPAAVAAIFTTKGRPAKHPLIVHVARDADLSHWAVDIPLEAYQLIAAFWPGPLTLILKRAPKVSDAVTGGQDSIGLRCPSHPVAQALLKTFHHGQGGLAAPSANRFGHVSPTTAQHVQELALMDAQTLTRPERYMAVVAKGDELLSWQEMTARYPVGTLRLLEGGDHALSDFETYADEVLAFCTAV